MVDSHDDRFLTGGAIELLGGLEERGTRSLIGQCIGGYELVEHLGSGGMGSVFRAKPADGRLNRDVAVKLLRGTMESSANRRFALEAEIHSRLTHPNIARLYDAGLSEPGSYLVMELVEGEPIDTYCETHNLTIDRRVELLLRVSRAVTYAHANLVIHRDIKPSNVLVDASGTPKLLDFGVAKLLDGSQAELTGDARILTPKYASPEQVRGEQITTSSDVFQLGALLYTALTGSSPFGDDSLSGAIARATTHEDPQLTSERARALPIELRAVISKCLATAVEDRYESAASLCNDLERYLNSYPVLARNPTWLDAFRKFVTRNRWETAIVSMLTLSLLVGNFVYLNKLDRSRAAAERENLRASAVKEFLIELFDRASPSSQSRGDLTVQGLVDDGHTLAEQRLSGQPEILSDIRHTLGRIYLSLEEFERSEILLRDALNARLNVFGEQSLQVADSYAQLGRLAMEQLGEHSSAPEYFEKALYLRESVRGKDAEYATVLSDLASYKIVYLQDYDEAIRLLEEAISIQNTVLPQIDGQRIPVLRQLMIAHERNAQYSLAQQIGETMLGAAETVYGKDHAQLVDPLYSLGRVHESQGRFARAGDYFDRALAIARTTYGDASSRTGNVALNLAHTLRLTGELPRAREKADFAVSSIREVYGEKGTDYAVALAVAGAVYQEQGDYEKAEDYLVTALSLYTEKFGPEHTHTAYGAMMLAHLYREAGQLEEAEPLYWQAHDNWELAHGADHPNPAKVKLYLADISLRTGELALARELLTDARRTNDKALPPGHDRIAEAYVIEGTLLLAEERTDTCANPLERGLRLRERRLPAHHRTLALTRIEFGDCLLAAGDPVGARRELEQAISVMRGHPAAAVARLERMLKALDTSQSVARP